jgi:hypothetical protein
MSEREGPEIDLWVFKLQIWSTKSYGLLTTRNLSRSILETALIRALRVFFPKPKADDDKSEFFAIYQRETDAYDREFTKKYDADTLIFLILVTHHIWNNSNLFHRLVCSLL